MRAGDTVEPTVNGTLQLGVSAAGVAAPVQLNEKNDTYIVAAVSNADTTGDAIDTSRAEIAWFWLNILSTSTPVGKLQILGSVDGSNYYALNVAAGNLYGSGFTHAGAATDIDYDGNAEVKCLVAIENPPPYLKVFNDHASGGTTGNKFNARYFLRS